MVWLFPFVCYTRSEIPPNLIEYSNGVIKSKFYGILKGSSLLTSHTACEEFVKKCGPSTVGTLLKLSESCLKDKEISPSNKLNIVQLVQVIAKSYDHNARLVSRSGILKVFYNLALLRNAKTLYYFKNGVDRDSVNTLAEYVINTIEELSTSNFYGVLVADKISPGVTALITKSKKIKEKLLKAGASFVMNSWDLPYHRNPSLKTLPGSNDLVHTKSLETKFKELQYSLSVIENEMTNIGFFDEVEIDEVKCTEFISSLSMYEHHNQMLIQECVDSEDLSNYEALMELDDYIKYLLTVSKNKISGEPMPARTFLSQAQSVLHSSRDTDLQCSAAVEEFTDDNNLSMEELGLSTGTNSNVQAPKSETVDLDDDDTMDYISKHTTYEPIKITPGYFSSMSFHSAKENSLQISSSTESLKVEQPLNLQGNEGVKDLSVYESAKEISAVDGDSRDNWASFSEDEDDVNLPPAEIGVIRAESIDIDKEETSTENIHIEDVNALISSLSDELEFSHVPISDPSSPNYEPTFNQPLDEDVETLCKDATSLKETLYHINHYLESKSSEDPFQKEAIMDDEEAFSRTVVNVHVSKFEKPVSAQNLDVYDSKGDDDAHMDFVEEVTSMEETLCIDPMATVCSIDVCDDTVQLKSADEEVQNIPEPSPSIFKVAHASDSFSDMENTEHNTKISGKLVDSFVDRNKYLYKDIKSDVFDEIEAPVGGTVHEQDVGGRDSHGIKNFDEELPQEQPVPEFSQFEHTKQVENSALHKDSTKEQNGTKSESIKRDEYMPMDFIDTTNVCNSATDLLHSISMHLDEPEPRKPHHGGRHPSRPTRIPTDGHSDTSSYMRHKDLERGSNKSKRSDRGVFAKDVSFDKSGPGFARDGNKGKHANSKTRQRTKEKQEYSNGSIIRACILYKKDIIYEDESIVVSFTSVSRYEPSHHLECVLSILNRGNRIIKHLQYNFMNFENFPLELLFLNNPKKVIEPGRVLESRFKVDCYGAYVGLPKVTILVIYDGVFDGKTVDLYLPLPITSFFTPNMDYRHLNSTEYYESANFKNIMQNKVYFKIKANIEYNEIIRIATLGGKFKILDSTRNDYGSVYLVSTYINRHTNSSFVEKFTVFCMIEKSMDMSFNLHVSSDSYRLSNSVATLYKYLFQH
ncbi:conserved hypothetical protein [Theileria equi strain WA]|uniref:Uncharacterized protein n=1 Tax=Theileria equi strain WA TaxID=1537102 RepID=L1LDW8_THEEQ|nr:conserved hypothetical protein [Theileria equi strain WA]EKX73474.1 conserved hypothetical protein [Theileria equi strain WA]|eukprot:XP_004832926.1 conserved hypothetical protein [Theileria equi strain WA]